MILSKTQLIWFVFTIVVSIALSYFFLDKQVALYFLSHIDTYEKIGDTLSVLGESHWYIGTAILGALLFHFKKNELYKQRFLFLLYINLFSGLISLVLKQLFGRMRPWGLRDGNDEYIFLFFENFHKGLSEKFQIHLSTLLDAPTTFSSFPSGHTTTVMAVATFLSLLFPKYKIAWFSTAVVLAFSRVLANDHFISDLLAGTLVGVLSTLFIYSKMRSKI